jgi:hypothetical protein
MKIVGMAVYRLKKSKKIRKLIAKISGMKRLEITLKKL